MTWDIGNFIPIYPDTYTTKNNVITKKKKPTK